MTVFVEWAKRQADLGTFRSRKDVWAFFRRVTFILVPAALVMNALAHVVMDGLGLLPYPLAPALAIGSITTLGIGVIVSLVFSTIIGSALLELTQERSKFEHLSRTDMLSGLLNRRAFTDACPAEYDDASMVIFDIDFFKKINDTAGHSAGDTVIVEVAKRLKAIFSERDLVARIGGEEFGVIVRGGAKNMRRDRVEAARSAIASSTVTVGALEIPVTVSAGMADFRPGRGTDDIYRQADRALYLAKAQGRNRLCHESQIETLNESPAATPTVSRTA